MADLSFLRDLILGGNRKPNKICEDEIKNSGLLAVTSLDNSSDDCSLVRPTTQRVGFAMDKLGKSAVVHAKAKPSDDISLLSQQWQADIGVNLRGPKYPERVFEIEPDAQSTSSENDPECCLDIEIWTTHSKVKHHVAHDDIPDLSDSHLVDTLHVEFDLPKKSN